MFFSLKQKYVVKPVTFAEEILQFSKGTQKVIFVAFLIGNFQILTEMINLLPRNLK